jgi:hypothetical protein
VQTRHPAKKSGRHGASSISLWFAGCHVRGTRQRFFNFFIISLPGAMSEAPSKYFFNFFSKFSLPSALPGDTRQRFFLIFFYNFFAGCHVRGTRQRFFLIFLIISLPGVAPLGTRQRVFLFFLVFSLPSALSGRHPVKNFFKKNKKNLCRVP